MKADTYAKLVVLEALIEAETGLYLEQQPRFPDHLREDLVARVSDLVDEIDALDAATAARVYDAIVDFLATLPPDDRGVIDSVLRLKRAVDRIVERGMDERELRQLPTWAVVLDELLATLARQYHLAVKPTGDFDAREHLRSVVLLARCRQAAGRMLAAGAVADSGRFRDDLDRLAFAVQHQRLASTEVGPLIVAAQRHAQRHRPSKLTRVGTFVLGQLLRRGAPRNGASRLSRRGRRKPAADAVEPQGT